MMELDQDPEAPTPARRSGSPLGGAGAMAAAQASVGPPRGKGREAPMKKKAAGSVGSSFDSAARGLGDSRKLVHPWPSWACFLPQLSQMPSTREGDLVSVKKGPEPGQLVSSHPDVCFKRRHHPWLQRSWPQGRCHF